MLVAVNIQIPCGKCQNNYVGHVIDWQTGVECSCGSCQNVSRSRDGSSKQGIAEGLGGTCVAWIVEMS